MLDKKTNSQASRKRQPKQKDETKKISLKESLNKVVGAIKKPFMKDKSKIKSKDPKPKPPRKKKHEKILIERHLEKEDIINENDVTIQPTEQQNDISQEQLDTTKAKKNNQPPPFAENSSQTTILSKFFYSNDRFLDTFDDMQIYETLKAQYPSIASEKCDDKQKRKIVLDLLNNESFVAEILEQYNMNVLDLFKFMFRMCPSLFKGFFIKKVQATIKNKAYAKNVRFGKYRYSGMQKRSKKIRLPI